MSKNNERAPSYDRRGFVQQAGVGLAGGTVLASTVRVGAAAAETRLAQGGESQGSIILGQQAGPFYRWMAEELQRYLRLLSGADFPITTAGSTATGTRILLGGPESNELVARAQGQGLVDFSNLKQDGFLLYTIELDGQPALVVAGNDEASTMYAAYDLLERLGIVFQITGDIIPEHKPNLSLPALRVRMEPALKYRGLHLRHFVVPWMGMDDFREFLDQLAKLKCNYLEFYWYGGAPWIEYSHGGEKKLIGDVYTRESGYTTWRINTATSTTSDVRFGKERFTAERLCAPEFQEVEAPEEAHRTARQLLKQIISYAHERKIQVWLGMGDCPGVPPNLGRRSPLRIPHRWAGFAIPPGDPAGLGIWRAALKSMIETYPEADGYWFWLAEGYFYSDDPETQKIIRQYDEYRKLIPSLDEIKKMGYYRPTTQEALESDIGLIHYGKELVNAIQKDHPSARLGVAVLGRSYLFKALDALIPRDVAFSSMECSGVWNRPRSTPPWTGTIFNQEYHFPVPMQLFADMGERERFLVPRLDDDATEFGMQFNVGLYHYDGVLEGSVENGVVGVAPQTGKLRGVEQNAKFTAQGAWNPSLTPEAFYRDYARRIFGEKGAALVAKALLTFHEFEAYLGWRGLDNFKNYAATQDIRILGRFKDQKNPFSGPDFDIWNVHKDGETETLWIQRSTARRERYAGGIERLKKGLAYLRQTHPRVLPGARDELEYLVFKTESYISHLEAIRFLLAGFIAYDRAFRAKLNGNEKEMLEAFDRCQFLFSQARGQARETAEQLARSRFVEDGTEKYILFCYNVRFLLPIEEFGKFIKNIVNFHHGQPYWEEVDWEVIAPRQWIDP